MSTADVKDERPARRRKAPATAKPSARSKTTSKAKANTKPSTRAEAVRAEEAASFRHPSLGQVDRTKPVRFTFDGEVLEGFEGDTLASAMLANGRHMLARSFKYHRPRGVLAAGAEDPSALVQIGSGARTEPNVKAAEVEIHDDLEARSQNCWPSLANDLGSVNDAMHRFLPAGFYYKTFMGASGLPGWMAFEPLIRRSAGLGRAPDPELRDPDSYETLNRHCDVLVVGGGAAGLSAALAAARTGARVILAEETAALGGELLSRDARRTRIDDMAPAEWVAAQRDELQACEEATILTRTCAFGYYGDNFLGLWEKVGDHLPLAARTAGRPRQRLWRVRAKQVVLATGAIERPLVFNENDRPGIMLAGAMRTFLHRYGVLPGKRVAFFVNNDTGWDAAFDLHDHGCEVAAIVDLAPRAADRQVKRALSRGILCLTHSAVVGTLGRDRIEAIEVCRLADGDRSVTGLRERIECDCLGLAGGWAPNVALFSQSRGRLKWDQPLQAFLPGQSWQRERSAGAANGKMTLRACIAGGIRAGVEAARETGFRSRKPHVPTLRDGQARQGALYPMAEVPSDREHPRAWVDFQDDVTTKDLKLALREGYESVEHAKRYTTTGMGTDQGKVANLNAFAFIAENVGLSVPEIGVTTFRQPYKPVTFAALAGQHVGAHFAPRRTTPMHAWHRAKAATFEPVGDWLRPRAYPRKGEGFEEAVQREARAARTHVGMLDASTLGKIDVRGKDAREFLNRVYTNAWSKLAPGRCRYGLMLGEDGMVMDDGVTACLADDHFHMTTTTGGAAKVLATLEDYLQTEWPDLRVHLTSVTEEWAVCSLSGPNAPALMDEVLDIDPRAESFPFMTWREAKAFGVPARVFRISFTGEETGYEINVAARYGLWLWERLIEAGERFGLTPYGTEAMHLLRAEKGFIIVGQETDGTVTPHDLGMPWIVSEKKPDFIGKRSLSRADTARAGRKQLVGLLTQDPQTVLEEGAQIIETVEEPKPPVPMLGHVTSSYMSPNLARSIALALVKGGAGRMGETLYVSREGEAPIPVRVCGVDFLAMEEAGDA